MQNESRRGRATAVLRAYYGHVRKYPLGALLIILGAAGLQVAEIASSLFLRQFFNLLATPSSGESTDSALLSAIVSFGLASFLGWLMRRVQVLALMYVEWNGMTDIFDSTFRYLVR